jgi:hypothetical protein
MSNAFLSWDGNQFYIRDAVARIEHGDPEGARRILQSARNDIAPHTRPLPLTYKGAEGQTVAPSDMHLYKALDEGFMETMNLLPRRPEEARERLLQLREQFGWTQSA